MNGMSQLSTSSGWSIGRPAPECAGCRCKMEIGAVCYAALCEGHLPQAHEEQPAPETPAADAAQAQAPDKPETKAAAKKEEPKEVSPYTRVDFCETCWSSGKRPQTPLEMFSFWKTTVPEPTAKKKLFVDDSVLIDLFVRLAERDSVDDIRLRFVLALILMRKRLLRYEGMVAGTEKETWRMRPRGEDEEVLVINPQLNESQIGEVSQQLSGILAEEV